MLLELRSDVPLHRPLSDLMAELRQLFGGRCHDCGATEGLEFSHQRPDGMSGGRGHRRRGRGGPNRYYAIRRNPENYRLRCQECHDKHDGIRRRRLAPDVKNETGETAVA